jgi:hypothetical protein
LPRTLASRTLLPPKLVRRLLPNLGVLAELSLVFPESVEVVLPDLVPPLSETCAEAVECSTQTRPGATGIDE